MQGNREPVFLDKINGVFICFVASAIRHCLKAWRTGKCATDDEKKKNKSLEFKYETAWRKYKRGKHIGHILTKGRHLRTADKDLGGSQA